MLGIHHYWLFIATAIALIITPGQDTFFILGRSLSGGRGDGIAAAMGVSAGTVVHTLLAALGLSALLATSPYAFMVVKFAGAAYLMYIGVRALLSRANGMPGEVEGPAQSANRRLWASFRQGMLTNLLNPKVALFFVTFLPQFLSVDSGSPRAEALLLSAIFAALYLAWFGLYIAAVDRLGRWLRRPRVKARIEQVTGLILATVAVRLATASH